MQVARETGFYLRAFKVFFMSEVGPCGMNCVFCYFLRCICSFHLVLAV